MATGINMDIVKNRLKHLQNSQNKIDCMWKPATGTQYLVRIVPYKFNRENPFTELYFYYGLGGKTFLSLYTFGKSDPVLEFCERLKATGGKEEYKQARKLEPKLRIYAPIVVRGEEAQGTKFWSFSKTVYEQLLSVIADPDYGDITDPINGRDILVEILPPANGEQYGKTNIRVKPKETVLANDKATLEVIMNSQKNLLEIYPTPTSDDLQIALERHLNPAAATAPTTNESAPVTTPAVSAPVSTPAPVVESHPTVAPVSTPAPTVSAPAPTVGISTKSADIEATIEDFEALFNAE